MDIYSYSLNFQGFVNFLHKNPNQDDFFARYFSSAGELPDLRILICEIE